MRLARSLEAWLNRARAASDRGVSVGNLPWLESVQPVEIVSDARPLIVPYQRTTYWERLAGAAPAPASGLWRVLGIVPKRVPIRILYWEIEAMGGSSLCGRINLGLYQPNAPIPALRPMEGPFSRTTTEPFSEETGTLAISGAQIPAARRLDWIEEMKPVIFPGEAFGCTTVVEELAITANFAWEELGPIDAVATIQRA